MVNVMAYELYVNSKRLSENYIELHVNEWMTYQSCCSNRNANDF